LIAQLQNRALELQQNLAVAVSVDRRKDTTIQQLDKVLSRVMEGWRRKEAERQALVQQLQLDKHNLQQALESQHQVGRHPLLFIALDSYKTLYFCCILFP